MRVQGPRAAVSYTEPMPRPCPTRAKPVRARPCSCPLQVGASDNNDQPAGFSNYGATSVDLFAPGEAGFLGLGGAHTLASGVAFGGAL